MASVGLSCNNELITMGKSILQPHWAPDHKVEEHWIRQVSRPAAKCPTLKVKGAFRAPSKKKKHLNF